MIFITWMYMLFGPFIATWVCFLMWAIPVEKLTPSSFGIAIWGIVNLLVSFGILAFAWSLRP